jgi:Ca-activated chloride channel family protein
MDVSRSMCSTDVLPNRITVAQNAARQFVKNQPGGVRIGLVVFAGIAGLVVPPTTDHSKLVDAINKLQTSRGTAIGMAILASIDAIAEHNSAVAPTGVVDNGDEGAPPANTEPDPNSVTAPTGPFQPDTIVVLTDGANTLGVPPLVAAQQAADRHIRVYTIGFGTTNPAPGVCTAGQVGRDVPGNAPFDVGGAGPGFGGGGNRRFLEIDEPTLQTVAKMTGGQYFRAQDADQLDKIFGGLPTEVVTQHRREELTVWFVLVGGLLAAAAIGLSMAWNRVT